MNELNFDLKLKEVPVSITTLDGQKKSYTLRELTGLQREEYNKDFDINMTLVDGKPQIQTGEKFKLPSEIDILVMCLYDNDNKVVSRDVLEKYPSTVVTSLHKTALELSGLDKDAEAKAKNDSEGKPSLGTE